MSITGAPDGEPQKVGVALVDILAGLFASVGILAALRHRDAGGEGQRVEVDLLSSLLAALVNQASGVHDRRRGARAGWATRIRASRPMSCTRPREGELVVAVGNDRQFAALCEVLGVAGAGRRPALCHQLRPRRPPRGAARRAVTPRWRAGPAAEWAARADRRPGPGRGRSTTSRARSRWPTSLGLEPVVEVPGRATGAATAGAPDPQPDRAVADPAPLSQRAAPARAAAGGR